MQVKIASFPADSGLLPVLSTTPNVARMNGPEEKPNYDLGIERGISGPIEYRAMVFMNSAGKLAGTEKSIAILDIKRKMPGVWLRLLSCSWQHT